METGYFTIKVGSSPLSPQPCSPRGRFAGLVFVDQSPFGRTDLFALMKGTEVVAGYRLSWLELKHVHTRATVCLCACLCTQTTMSCHLSELDQTSYTPGATNVTKCFAALKDFIISFCVEMKSLVFDKWINEWTVYLSSGRPVDGCWKEDPTPPVCYGNVPSAHERLCRALWYVTSPDNLSFPFISCL